MYHLYSSKENRMVVLACARLNPSFLEQAIKESLAFIKLLLFYFVLLMVV